MSSDIDEIIRRTTAILREKERELYKEFRDCGMNWRNEHTESGYWIKNFHFFSIYMNVQNVVLMEVKDGNSVLIAEHLCRQMTSKLQAS